MRKIRDAIFPTFVSILIILGGVILIYVLATTPSFAEECVDKGGYVTEVADYEACTINGVTVNNG